MQMFPSFLFFGLFLPFHKAACSLLCYLWHTQKGTKSKKGRKKLNAKKAYLLCFAFGVCLTRSKDKAKKLAFFAKKKEKGALLSMQEGEIISTEA